MALTGMLNLRELLPLFTRAQQGDKEAQSTVQKLGPMLTDQADQAEIEDTTPGLATTLGGKYAQDLGPARQDARLSEFTKGSSGFGPKGNFNIQGVDEQRPSWKEKYMPLLEGLQGGISGYLSVAHPGYRPSQGGIVGKWKEEQLDALKRKHAMWESTYEMAQGLPQEVLADPRLSALASAKQALDKDMMDGKIDNEKSVSNFLTELQRHKADVEVLSQQAKIGRQVAGEGQLQEGRVAAGLAEPMVEVNLYGQVFKLPASQAAAITGKTQAAELERYDAQQKLKREEELRIKLAQIAASGRRPPVDPTQVDNREFGNRVRAELGKAVSQLIRTNPDLPQEEQFRAAAQQFGEQLLMRADQQGLVDEEEGGYTFNGVTYEATPEGIADLHEALAKYFIFQTK